MLSTKLEVYYNQSACHYYGLWYDLSKFADYISRHTDLYTYGRQCAIVKDGVIILCFGVHFYHPNRYDYNYAYALENVTTNCTIIPWELVIEYDKWVKKEEKRKQKIQAKKDRQKKEEEEKARKKEEQEKQEKMEKFSKLQIIIISKLA